jgi:hypothetical protein
MRTELNFENQGLPQEQEPQKKNSEYEKISDERASRTQDDYHDHAVCLPLS